MAKVYLGLGSNLGDREANLRQALERLRALGKISHLSSLYETEPVGYLDQPWFLNAVCQLETKLGPEELLETIKTIEVEMGRTETIRFGPRIIDIDILLYDDLVLDLPHLQIPHPRMHERAFVLVPLAEIAPDALHPILSKTAKELLEGLLPSSDIRPWQP